MKVLLADTESDRADRVAAQLSAAGATAVVHLGPGEGLVEAVRRTVPDLVIVDMARPDRDSLDGIRHIARDLPRPIVMFVDEDDPAFMEAAIAAGVSSYNVVGTRLPAVKPIIQAAVAMFRRHAEMAAALRRVEASLRERVVIDQAKSLLIRQHRFQEPDAYRWLRRQAMDSGRRIADVAAALVAAHERSEATANERSEAKGDGD